MQYLSKTLCETMTSLLKGYKVWYGGLRLATINHFVSSNVSVHEHQDQPLQYFLSALVHVSKIPSPVSPILFQNNHVDIQYLAAESYLECQKNLLVQRPA